MQIKGIIKWLVLLLGVASILQLSFTFVTRSVEADAEAYAEKVAKAEVAKKKAAAEAEAQALIEAGEEPMATMHDFDKDYQLAYENAYQSYLDKKGEEPVYNLLIKKYTYNECKEKELSLGLDLKGGMNVMLEIKAGDVIRGYADEVGAININDDQGKELRRRFEDALAVAEADKNASTDDVIAKFIEAGKKSGLNFGEVFNIKDTSKLADTLDKRVKGSVDVAFEVLNKRIDLLGVIQPTITKVTGTNRIMVELPGVKEPERVSRILASTAALEFWNVCDDTYEFNQIVKVLNSDEFLQGFNNHFGYEYRGRILATQSANGAGQVAIADKAIAEKLREYMALPQTRRMFAEDVKLCWANESVDGTTVLYALKGARGTDRPLMGGAGITANPATDPMTNKVEVEMFMESEVARKWGDITTANVGRCVAIVLDDYVYSAPVIQVPITNGVSSISGTFSYRQAEELAGVLNAGKSPAKATVVQAEVVGPTLGEQSIKAGILSFVLAFVLVLLYMAFFYNTAGWMANIALLFNVLLLMGVLVSFGATLTLPGIAGIVLTMGMAVDANVIIFERIKEELRAGKGLSLAIKDGFSNAYSAIIDGNLTTIITGAVLFFMGTGPVKGFATTLVLGIITSLFCAIFITRVLLEALAERRGKLAFSTKITENFLRNVKFNFVAKRKFSYLFSGLLVLVSIVSLLTLKLNLGIEFTGGRDYVVRFDKTVNVEDVRDKLEDAFKAGDAANKSLEVKQFGNENQIRITTQFTPSQKMIDEVQARVNADLGIVEGSEVDQNDVIVVDADYVVKDILFNVLKDFYSKNEQGEPNIDYAEFTTDSEYGIVSSNQVDGSISSEMTYKSLIAVAVALLAIGIYIAIRFRRWQWAMGATVALAHNAFLVIGIFSLLYAIMPFNLEVNQAFIAAILTIIGYSINDTVVIFDRIREYIGLYPKRDIKTNIDNAICATLSRTINTSGTTLVTLLSIFIFGGETIRGFVFALILGVVIGTYSSVFIATPIAYDLQRKKAIKPFAAEEQKAE